MLRYLQHHEIDFAQWDACLHEAPNGLVYGLSWYLEVVSPGWEAIVKEEAGKYVAIMPLPVARKFGIKFLKQPLLTQQLGVFNTEPLSQVEWQQLFELLKKHFRIISNYAFNTGNTITLPQVIPGFEFRKNTTFHLDLQQPYRQLYLNFNKGRKAVVNQAKKRQLSIRVSENVNLLQQLFETFTFAKIAGFRGEGYTYEILKKLISQAQIKNSGQLYEVVSAKGEVEAMAFFTLFNKKLIYLFSTTSEQGRKSGAITFLLNYLMEKNAGTEICFDFEAPQISSPGAESIISFYRSFGPEPVKFISVSLNNLPPILKLFKAFRKNIYRFLKK